MFTRFLTMASIGAITVFSLTACTAGSPAATQSGVKSAGSASEVAAAGGSQQRISITTAKGDGHTWVLKPLTSGPLTRDAGSKTVCCFTDNHVTRDGESMAIDDPNMTYHGKNGTFTMQVVVDWIEAGHGYSIGTGTWKIIPGSGTGAYQHLQGQGRIAVNWPDNADWLSSQAQGLVDLDG